MSPTESIRVRPMRESDLEAARRIFRVAFGTFLGAPDPERFWTDREYLFTRWRGRLGDAVVAESGGEVVGSNFAANWGSFGFFGPLTVRPDLWDKKVAQQLLGPTMDLFESWGVREAGLFTFPHSAKHVGLYQKFGFWPRFLTALMSKSVEPGGAAPPTFSALSEAERERVLAECRELTGSIFEGLDLTREIRSVQDQALGDTVLIGGDRLEAFAVCHCGEGSEAGAGACYVKFGAARPGNLQAFEQMVDACEALASSRGLKRVDTGVNLGRGEAYRAMLGRGYRTMAQGVAMHRGDLPGFCRAGVYVLDDWR